jgi:CelD/BcsL family acetyltransferase involved in cellulose biosynthesis
MRVMADEQRALTSSECSKSAIQFEVIDNWADLQRLEDEWKLLWHRGRRSFVLQSFEATNVIRRVPLHDRRTKLWCLVGREKGILIFVWPFVRYVSHGWRYATPLASHVDCSDPLLLDCREFQDCMRSAWSYLFRECPCDLFHFQFVRQNMPLRDAIASVPSRVPIYQLELPLVEFSGGWSEYEKLLDRRQHSGFSRKRRRLLEIGDVRCDTLEYDTPGIAEWIVEHKRRWLARNGWVDKIRLTHPQYTNFLKAVLSELGPDGRCRVFAIRQGDRLVAADINFVDQHTMQWYVGTFDQEFARYSPGQLLKEFVIRWAFDHQLIYDMLGGTGQHKNYLATNVERVTTWRLGRTPWGRVYVSLRRKLFRATAI